MRERMFAEAKRDYERAHELNPRDESHSCFGNAQPRQRPRAAQRRYLRSRARRSLTRRSPRRVRAWRSRRVRSQADAGLEPGVHVDPGSPAAKEYVIPLTMARQTGAPGSSAGSSAALFGAGIGPRGPGGTVGSAFGYTPRTWVRAKITAGRVGARNRLDALGGAGIAPSLACSLRAPASCGRQRFADRAARRRRGDPDPRRPRRQRCSDVAATSPTRHEREALDAVPDHRRRRLHRLTSERSADRARPLGARARRPLHWRAWRTSAT